MSKRRAAAIVIGGVVITIPLQFAIALAGLTDTFADADARYVLDTRSWIVYVAVTAVVGLGLAFGLAWLLTRRLARPVRRVVLARFICSLALIVALGALSGLGHVEYDGQGQVVSQGLSPAMLLIWVAGTVIAVWWLRRAGPASRAHDVQMTEADAIR